MYTIVCLGDSITCEWDEPHYPTYWQQLCDQKFGPKKYRVISAGVNGETAADGLLRLEEDVLVADPDLITIMFGHNDLFQGIDPTLFEDHLHQIVRYLQDSSPADIWLLTPNQVSDPRLFEIYKPYLTVIKSLAKLLKIGYVNLWSVYNKMDISSIYTYPEDFVHPNALGHQLLAQKLIQ